MNSPFIIGRRLYLRPSDEADFGAHYFGWLNDPEVLALRNQRLFPTEAENVTAFRSKLDPKSTLHLAIIARQDELHIGNIQLGPINWIHRKAEISIIIGEKAYWGYGFGREAIYLMTKHAFRQGNLHRVYAGSANPGFVRAVEQLGWTKECEERESFWDGRRYASIYCHSMLAQEFVEHGEYEPLLDYEDTKNE